MIRPRYFVSARVELKGWPALTLGKGYFTDIYLYHIAAMP